MLRLAQRAAALRARCPEGSIFNSACVCTEQSSVLPLEIENSSFSGVALTRTSSTLPPENENSSFSGGSFNWHKLHTAPRN